MQLHVTLRAVAAECLARPLLHIRVLIQCVLDFLPCATFHDCLRRTPLMQVDMKDPRTQQWQEADVLGASKSIVLVSLPGYSYNTILCLSLDHAFETIAPLGTHTSSRSTSTIQNEEFVQRVRRSLHGHCYCASWYSTHRLPPLLSLNSSSSS